MSIVNVVYPDGKRVPITDLCFSPESTGSVSIQQHEEISMSNQITDVILFHANCHDGRMAAAIVLDATVDYIAVPINYDSNDIPAQEYLEYIAGKVSREGVELKTYISLTFVDFCPKPEQAIALAEAGYSVLILDHHASAFDAMVAGGFTAFTSDKRAGWKFSRKTVGNFWHAITYHYAPEESGAMMAYKFYHGEDATVPDYVKWVSDRDLWKFHYPETKPFAAGMSRYMSVHPSQFSKLLTTEKVAETLQVGQALMDAQDAYVEKQLRNSIRILNISSTLLEEYEVVKPLKVAIYNNTYLPSELADAYFKSQSEVDAIALYTVVDEKRVIYSMRSREGVSSVWLAKHFGGGGHDNANGFTTCLQTLLDFLLEGEI